MTSRMIPSSVSRRNGRGSSSSSIGRSNLKPKLQAAVVVDAKPSSGFDDGTLVKKRRMPTPRLLVTKKRQLDLGGGIRKLEAAGCGKSETEAPPPPRRSETSAADEAAALAPNPAADEEEASSSVVVAATAAAGGGGTGRNDGDFGGGSDGCGAGEMFKPMSSQPGCLGQRQKKRASGGGVKKLRLAKRLLLRRKKIPTTIFTSPQPPSSKKKTTTTVAAASSTEANDTASETSSLSPSSSPKYAVVSLATAKATANGGGGGGASPPPVTMTAAAARNAPFPPPLSAEHHHHHPWPQWPDQRAKESTTQRDCGDGGPVRWHYDVGPLVHPASHGNLPGPLRAAGGRRWASADFGILRQLGKGKFGMVYEATDRSSSPGGGDGEEEEGVKHKVALKIMNKEKVMNCKTNPFLLRREVEIQTRLDHPNIVRCHGYHHDDVNLSLVLESSPHGDLYRRAGSNPIPIRQASSYLSQVARALEYLQENHVAHRDLKPENLLLFGRDMEVIKLCDFGWAVHAPPPTKNMRITLCGTAEFCPPEMLEHEEDGSGGAPSPTPPLSSPCGSKSSSRMNKKKGGRRRKRYDASKIDIWALAVLAYEMVTGQTPFFVSEGGQQKAGKADSQEAIFERIRNFERLEDEAFAPHAETAAEEGERERFESFRGFVRALMTRDPRKRMPMSEAVRHPFLAVETDSVGN